MLDRVLRGREHVSARAQTSAIASRCLGFLSEPGELELEAVSCTFDGWRDEWRLNPIVAIGVDELV